MRLLNDILTHRGRVTKINVIYIDQHYFRKWLVVCLCQAIIWTSDVLMSNWCPGTNITKGCIKIELKKILWKWNKFDNAGSGNLPFTVMHGPDNRLIYIKFVAIYHRFSTRQLYYSNAKYNTTSKSRVKRWFVDNPSLNTANKAISYSCCIVPLWHNPMT